MSTGIVRRQLVKVLCGRPLSSVVLEASPVSEEALQNARPFEEIPGPKHLPFIGNLHRYMPLIGEYSTKQWHDSVRLKFHQYGPIVRERLVPGMEMVFLYDPKDLETVSRHEGKFPQRDFFLAMRKLREDKPELYTSVGVAAANGEPWYDMRSKVQKAMMKPQIMKMFLPQMNVIADDLIGRIRNLRDENGRVPMLINEFFKWALESVTYILFNERMGCLDYDIRPDSMAQKYIDALNGFFRSTAEVELSFVPIWRIFPMLSPSFRNFRKVHDFFFENAMEYVKKNLDGMKGREQDEDDSDLSLMQMLMKHCTPQMASVMAVDSMAAGIDTTALTMSYVLRNLADNPEAQKKLQEEVDRIVPNGQQLTVQAMDQMTYLKACIKESMRITPTVQGTSRVLDRDIVLSGYRVPAKTQFMLNYYVSSVQESNFPDPLVYRPERWLKGESKSAAGSFAFQPFGFGPRMCIGRRIADLELITLLTKVMQNFWVENHSQELDINFQLVLMIKSPLKYEFYDRH